MQVELQTRRAMGLRQCKINPSLLNSERFIAGISIWAPVFWLGLSSWKTGSLWGQRQGQALCYAMCAGGISDLKDDVAQAEQDSSFVFGVL